MGWEGIIEREINDYKWFGGEMEKIGSREIVKIR